MVTGHNVTTLKQWSVTCTNTRYEMTNDANIKTTDTFQGYSHSPLNFWTPYRDHHSHSITGGPYKPRTNHGVLLQELARTTGTQVSRKQDNTGNDNHHLPNRPMDIRMSNVERPTRGTIEEPYQTSTKNLGPPN